MLHRVLLGSLERFIGALIENYNGDFPLWLAPLQALIIPIKDSTLGYANEIKDALSDAGLRVGIDARNETLDKKIRNAELDKVPYILVVGQREEKSKSVAVRKKGKKDIVTASLADFIKQAKIEAENKALSC